MERPGIFKASFGFRWLYPILFRQAFISYGRALPEDPSRGGGARTSYQHPGRRYLVLLQALSCPQASPSTWARQGFEERWGTMSPISSCSRGADISVLVVHR